MKIPKLHFEDRASWRSWLERNHESSRELWVVFFKKHTGRPTLSYDDAVEEALCFGWIDSLVKRLDNDRFARKFTPRAPRSRWSELNLDRFQRLKTQGLMTAAGLAKIDLSATPEVPPRKRTLKVPEYFQDALSRNDAAHLFFDLLAPSYQRNFVGWVDSAKRVETRLKRLAEAITLLENRQRLGMK